MRRLVLACAVLACLTGCSGRAQPIEPTNSSASTSDGPAVPTPTSTLTPPTLPKQAESNDATGAANFVLYWVKAYNYAASTGDTREMRKHARDCKVCIGYANDFDGLSPRQYLAGDAWELADIKQAESPSGYEIDANVSAFGESHVYKLTFVLRNANPFELVHIYERQ